MGLRLVCTCAVCDGGQADAVLQQLVFGPVVHRGADGQHGARLLPLQQVWLWFEKDTDMKITLNN